MINQFNSRYYAEKEIIAEALLHSRRYVNVKMLSITQPGFDGVTSEYAFLISSAL